MTEIVESLWLDAHGRLSLRELTQLADITESELQELIDFGALTPLDSGADAVWFGADCIVALRSACRLRREFDLDLSALALSLRLLERIRTLEAQLRSTQAQLPRRRH